jgi:hypothetical protein
LFAACAFPVHTWAILRLLNELPAWLLRLSTAETAGVVAYTLAYTLLESSVLFVFLVLLAAFLPGELFRKRFVAQGSIFVYVSATWALLFHMTDERLWRNGWAFLGWMALYLLSLLAALALVQRNDRLHGALVSFADRLLPLTWLYLVADVASVVGVVVRNV